MIDLDLPDYYSQMNHKNLEVLCLQKHPEYYEQTITLLNQQWPRSRTARLRSLEQGSKDGLPTSLVLVHTEPNGKRSVVAHSKISPVPYKPKICFVESVVVAAELRGKGLGRLIMQETEKYVLSLGVSTVYLTTFDQQEFYAKLGYEFSDPIVVFGGSLKLAAITDNFNVLNCADSVEVSDNDCENFNKISMSTIMHTNVPAPGPPPPPPPPPLPSNNNARNTSSAKLTMKKILKG